MLAWLLRTCIAAIYGSVCYFVFFLLFIFLLFLIGLLYYYLISLSHGGMLLQISVDHELLPEDLRVLLKEVEQLRETADKIVCWCSELDCPFKRPGSLHLALSDTKSSLPISRDVVSDCDVVDDDQTSESNQNSVFLRREPARIGTAPNKRRICPSPRSRARVGSVPNTESVLNRLTVPQRYSELIFTPMSVLSSSA